MEIDIANCQQFEIRFVGSWWLVHVGFQSRDGSLIVFDLNPENDPFGVQVGKLAYNLTL